VFTENSNIPHGNGEIDLSNFSPFPKNPVIAKFFKQIGLVEELGSSIRNSYKYSKFYSGKNPEFIEDDIFKTVIFIPSLHKLEGVNSAVKQKIAAEIKALYIDKILTRKQLAAKLNIKHRMIERHLKILRE